jgi:hypothetical protein
MDKITWIMYKIQIYKNNHEINLVIYKAVVFVRRVCISKFLG